MLSPETPMMPQALTFALTSPGELLMGIAVVCLESRYASVFWAGHNGISRAFAAPRVWRDIVSQVELGLPTQPLDDCSPIAQLFSGVRSLRVRWVHALSLPLWRPEQADAMLDRLLRDVASRNCLDEPAR
jgi:hypothetical protein